MRIQSLLLNLWHTLFRPNPKRNNKALSLCQGWYPNHNLIWWKHVICSRKINVSSSSPNYISKTFNVLLKTARRCNRSTVPVTTCDFIPVSVKQRAPSTGCNLSTIQNYEMYAKLICFRQRSDPMCIRIQQEFKHCPSVQTTTFRNLFLLPSSGDRWENKSLLCWLSLSTLAI